MIVECRSCNVMISGVEIAHYTIEPDNYLPFGDKKYTFLKCPVCQMPILTKQVSYFDESDMRPSGFPYGKPEQLYPSNEFHINPEIPKELKLALLESIKCYRNGANTATVIMCRRTIEGFCFMKGINGGNLAKSIEKLKDEKIINEQLFEWANALRISGNEAAHNIEATFENTDAKDILDFTIAILDFSYSFQDKFNTFKARREAIKNSSK